MLIEPGLNPQDIERLTHLAFQTSDVAAMGKYLTSRGLKIDQPADRCEETAIHVMDPDGHVIEFVQAPWPPPAPKPGAASDCRGSVERRARCRRGCCTRG